MASETVPRLGFHGTIGLPEPGGGMMLPGIGIGQDEVWAITGEFATIGENRIENIIALNKILLDVFVLFSSTHYLYDYVLVTP